MRIINPLTWEELRSKILKAIEEEKRAKAQIFLPTVSGVYPELQQQQKYFGSTANQASYEIPKDMPFTMPTASGESL